MTRKTFWRLMWGWTFLVFFLKPILAQESLLGPLQDARRLYPAHMTAEQTGELLNRVASSRPGWGLHLKTSGERCPLPRTAVTIDCGILVHWESGQVFDVLAHAAGEGDNSRPQWGDPKGPINSRANYVSPVPLETPPPAPGPGPTPAPIPAPVPAIDLGPVLQRLDQLLALEQQDLSRQEQTFEQTQQQHGALAAQLKAHDEEPSWIGKHWRSVLEVVGGSIGVWIATQMNDGGQP